MPVTDRLCPADRYDARSPIVPVLILGRVLPPCGPLSHPVSIERSFDIVQPSASSGPADLGDLGVWINESGRFFTGPMFSACASEHSHGIQPTLE